MRKFAFFLVGIVLSWAFTGCGSTETTSTNGKTTPMATPAASPAPK